MRNELLNAPTEPGRGREQRVYGEMLIRQLYLKVIQGSDKLTSRTLKNPAPSLKQPPYSIQ